MNENQYLKRTKSPSLSKDDLEHLRMAREFEAMTSSEGWKIYTSILQGHLKIKESELLQPSMSVDAAVASNAVKGAILSLRLALDTVPNIIKIAKEIRESHAPGDEWS